MKRNLILSNFLTRLPVFADPYSKDKTGILLFGAHMVELCYENDEHKSGFLAAFRKGIPGVVINSTLGQVIIEPFGLN